MTLSEPWQRIQTLQALPQITRAAPSFSSPSSPAGGGQVQTSSQSIPEGPAPTEQQPTQQTCSLSPAGAHSTAGLTLTCPREDIQLRTGRGAHGGGKTNV